LSNEKGVEVKGYKTTKARESIIRFQGSDVKVEVVKKIKFLYSNVKVELVNEHGFEVNGYHTAKFGSFKLGFQGSNVKMEVAIEIGSCLGLESIINIKLANPKSISLHQKLTLIPAPRPNVRTNIIDRIYIERYKKYLYYLRWAYNVPRHSHVEGSARIVKSRRFPKMVI
jgi:hypothetical protein